ncbi:hypothetical protein O1611_g8806 [Lasiodiplodia mahajangana]|uniref:Uncharacterized protein n=1 Tax=Lasiodiplodia mahajangana TaxID=1108764 RepID=A0ACC2JBH1_9PEZI|nr:hypothetical protein O1611_g8806 [Lasiodiplodia mahajangana]
MSSPAARPRESKEKKGMDKVLYKVKNVFHRKGGSSRKGQSSAAPAPAPILQTAALPVRGLPEYEGATRIPRIQIHEERAKKLGARFGLEIKPSEWHSSEGDVLRVDKPVRMRIHRECHRCKSRFGAGNTEAERQANREKREALIQKHKDMAPIIPSYDYSPQIVLKRPRKAPTQDLVYKGRPRMRPGSVSNVATSAVAIALGILTTRRVILMDTLMTNLVPSLRAYSPATSARPSLSHTQKMAPNARNALTRSVRNACASNQEKLNQNPTLRCWRRCDFAWPSCRRQTADNADTGAKCKK